MWWSQLPWLHLKSMIPFYLLCFTSLEVQVALVDLKPTQWSVSNVSYLGYIIIVIVDMVTLHSNWSWWTIETLQKFHLNLLQLHLHFYSLEVNHLK